MKTSFDLYKKFYIDKHDESKKLFQKLSEMFKIRSALYPGSFVHVTPSFFIPELTYVDTDKRCQKFFDSYDLIKYINHKKRYEQNAQINYINADFTQINNLLKNNYDLLISLYAGFISKYCKQYLKKGGLLLANDSHGDATIAYLDKSFELIDVVKIKNNGFEIKSLDLEKYFIPKKRKPIKIHEVEVSMKGPVYKEEAYAYLFKKIN